MNTIITSVVFLVLIAAGLSLIVWNKKISMIIYALQLPGLKSMFGDRVDLSGRWIRVFYKTWVVLAGTFLLIGAFAVFSNFLL